MRVVITASHAHMPLKLALQHLPPLTGVLKHYERTQRDLPLPHTGELKLFAIPVQPICQSIIATLDLHLQRRFLPIPGLLLFCPAKTNLSPLRFLPRTHL